MDHHTPAQTYEHLNQAYADRPSLLRDVCTVPTRGKEPRLPCFRRPSRDTCEYRNAITGTRYDQGTRPAIWFDWITFERRSDAPTFTGLFTPEARTRGGEQRTCKTGIGWLGSEAGVHINCPVGHRNATRSAPRVPGG